jgi:NAD-dependent dihydropyrimidine dehydrogenase PreA subunit
MEWKRTYPKIDPKKCTGALACYEVCPSDVFDVDESTGVKKALVARPEDCVECEQCVDACPEDAIELVD